MYQLLQEKRKHPAVSNKITKRIKTIFIYGSTPPCTHIQKKMDALFLGVSHVVPCCVLWIFSRVSTGA